MKCPRHGSVYRMYIQKEEIQNSPGPTSKTRLKCLFSMSKNQPAPTGVTVLFCYDFNTKGLQRRCLR